MSRRPWKPVRLKFTDAGFPAALAALGPLCLQSHTRSLEHVAWLDPCDTALVTDGIWTFPALGLSIHPDRIAAIHASPMPRLPGHAGIIELDLLDGDRVSFAVSSGSEPARRFHEIIGTFGKGDITCRELEAWRGKLRPPLTMCPCCREAGEKRVARPQDHPLARILHHCASESIELHLEIRQPGFSLSGFLTPAPLGTAKGIVLNSVDRLTILRIDPLLLHSLWILPLTIDLECRATVQAYDPLGQLLVSLSCAQPELVPFWQRQCRSPK